MFQRNQGFYDDARNTAFGGGSASDLCLMPGVGELICAAHHGLAVSG
ncbi:hypothetical protein BITS_1839 [Bifidobacterium tsurumiense]|uniref:Uncharacterized protein n=1 Tax=Bifidobacterium tsurumiense TaxID=356829 RepID=A0A087EE22_9BIFI|nr:hypothetical protein BITS_1839 [Bifidobacterium tsurumiense]